MKPHTIKRKKMNNAPSMTSAAARLGLKIEAVQMAKAGGCRAFRVNGSVHCDELKAWLLAHPEIGEAVAKIPDAKLERALKYQAERKLKEAELGQLEGSLVKKDDAKRVLTRFAMANRTRLLALPARCAFKVSLVKDPAEVEAILRQEVIGILGELFKGASAFDEITCPHCKKEIKP
jgi:hypothetical protein